MSFKVQSVNKYECPGNQCKYINCKIGTPPQAYRSLGGRDLCGVFAFVPTAIESFCLDQI